METKKKSARRVFSGLFAAALQGQKEGPMTQGGVWPLMTLPGNNPNQFIMGASTLNNVHLAKELKKIILSLEPVINLQSKELLIEIESRLKAGLPTSQKAPTKKQGGKTKKEMTYALLYAKGK